MATLGWRGLTFTDIVATSGVPLADAYRVYQSKMGVLLGVIGATDRSLLESLDQEPLDGSPRDRLFDLIMRRFDQHSEHKAAFSALLRDLRHHPLEALCVTARVERSMALLLDLAGVPGSGLRGLLRVKALGALYLHVFGRWLKDDSADSAATMALLDKRLEQAERTLGFIRRVRPHHRGADEAEQSASAR
jgi:AcrR family transcriptional regulator